MKTIEKLLKKHGLISPCTHELGFPPMKDTGVRETLHRHWNNSNCRHLKEWVSSEGQYWEFFVMWNEFDKMAFAAALREDTVMNWEVEFSVSAILIPAWVKRVVLPNFNRVVRYDQT